MKSWRRTLAIGFIIAITSQLYWNVFVNNFRVSASVILLPVLIMTVGSQIHTMTICTVTSIIVFLFRIVIYYLQGMPSEMLVQLAMPGAFFYIVYGMMFKLQIRNKHIANLENVIAAAFFCDLCSNIFENFLAALLKNNAMPGPDIIQKLFMIAAVRTLFVALALIGEQQYRLLLTKADHESRYQRLFLMTTGLKTEIYLMHKNTEEIERVMSNAYKLYEQILEKDLPREMLQVLSDAQDLPVLDADTMLQELEQTTGDVLFAQGAVSAGDQLQATDMTGNPPVLSAEQLTTYAEKFGMTEEQLTGLTKQLQDMHFDAQTIQTVLAKSDTTMQLANHLQALVAGAADKSMINAETMKEFFTSDGMKELLAAAVKEKFTLNPEKMQNPQEVSDLYKGIYEKMDRLMQQMSSHTGSSGEYLSESAKGMQERIDFLQNLSNLFPYAQIPVRMEGGDRNADLFVYMNKKRMQEKKEDVSALLHLDMEYLGPTDVHVSLRGTIVHTKFYVEDEESAKIIDAHMTQLEQAIAENGYSLTNEVIMREPTLHPDTEKNAVVKEMFGDDIEKSVKRYSFDVRM